METLYLYTCDLHTGIRIRKVTSFEKMNDGFKQYSPISLDARMYRDKVDERHFGLIFKKPYTSPVEWFSFYRNPDEIEDFIDHILTMAKKEKNSKAWVRNRIRTYRKRPNPISE